MATGNISKRTVDAAEPADRPTLLWDTSLKGFGLLVLPSAVKSYVFQYRIGGRGGKTKRYTIGKHGSPWTPDKARKRAEDIAELVRRGIDPIDSERAERAARIEAEAAAAEEERKGRELLFSSYVEKFLTSGMRADASGRTRGNYRGMLRNHVLPVIGGMLLPAISRADLVRTLDRIPADQPSVRNMVFAIVRKLFNWARARGDIEVSPADGMETPPPVASRDRVLSDVELALALRAAAILGEPFGPYYQLLFATGQRREEVAGLNWSELHRATAIWALPAERTKNAEANVVPLSTQAVDLLDRLAGQVGEADPKWPLKGLVFTTTGKTSLSGFSRGKARLDAKMLELAKVDAAEAGNDPDEVTLQPWRLHDARRTLATTLQRLGVRFEVTEAVLNHTSGSRSGVAGVYQRHNWATEKRAALQSWADHCEQLINPRPIAGNVVRLRRKRNSPG